MTAQAVAIGSAGRVPWIPGEAYGQALQLVGPGGKTWQGGHAIEQLLKLLPLGGAIGWVFKIPYFGVGFEYVEKPHRIGKLEVALDWPSLPAERREAARRAAGLCPIHRTLHALPEVTTVVTGAAQTAGAGA